MNDIPCYYNTCGCKLNSTRYIICEYRSEDTSINIYIAGLCFFHKDYFHGKITHISKEKYMKLILIK